MASPRVCKTPDASVLVRFQPLPPERDRPAPVVKFTKTGSRATPLPQADKCGCVTYEWERNTAVSEYTYDDFDNDNDLVKRLRKEIEKRDAALKERDSEFNKLQDEVRRQNVSTILRDMGVKPKVANLIPKDIEANPDAVKAWVSDYEDVFGSVKTSEEKPTNRDDENTDSPEGQAASQSPLGMANVDPEMQAAFQRMQIAESSTGTVPTGEDAQLSWLANAARQADGDADKYFAFLRGEIQP